MVYKIRYRKKEYRGYGRYATKFVTKSEMLKYLKKYNPTATKREINKMLKSSRVKLDKYDMVVKKK